MPTYNRAAVISEAIRSVLSQTFADFELIIINDGSTDNTKEVVSKFKDNRILYLEKPNGGPASARNLGLKYALGEYIAYLDDDDIYYPDHLRASVEFLDKHPQIGMVYSDFNISVNALEDKEKKRKDIFQKKRLETTCLFHTSTVVHRRECIEKTGFFDETLLRSQDWDMWLRISDYYEIKHLPRVLTRVTTLCEERVEPILKSTMFRKVIEKRIAKAQRDNRFLQYIHDCSIMVIKSLINSGNLLYADKLADDFYRRSYSYHTLTCQGLCSLGRGDFKQAESLFERSLKLAPKNWSRLNPWERENVLVIKTCLAKTYYHLNKIGLATRLCKEILKLMPDNTEARIEIARCYLKQNAYEKALDFLKESDYNPAIYNLRGCCYFKKGAYIRAIREFKNAIVLEPKIPLYHYNLATVYDKQKDYTNAQIEYEKVLQLEPKYKEAKEALKKIYAKIQKIQS